MTDPQRYRPYLTTLALLQDVVALHHGLPVLVVSMHDELIYAERVLRAGARGYVSAYDLKSGEFRWRYECASHC